MVKQVRAIFSWVWEGGIEFGFWYRGLLPGIDRSSYNLSRLRAEKKAFLNPPPVEGLANSETALLQECKGRLQASSQKKPTSEAAFLRRKKKKTAGLDTVSRGSQLARPIHGADSIRGGVVRRRSRPLGLSS